MADPEYDGLSLVVVEAVTADIDGNIKPGNIKKGVTILGVTGTLDESSGLYSVLILGDTGSLSQDNVDNLLKHDLGYVIFGDTTDPDQTLYVSCLVRARDNTTLTFWGIDNDQEYFVNITIATRGYTVTRVKRVKTLAKDATDNEIPTGKAVVDYVTSEVNTIKEKYYTKPFTISDFTQVGGEQKYVISITKDEHGLTNPIVLKMVLSGETSSTVVYEDKVLSTGTVKIYVMVDLQQLLQYNGKIYLQGE